MSLAGNTEKLNSLIAAINALPDAGEGGGNATLNTCTIVVNNEIVNTGTDGHGITGYVFLTMENGAIKVIGYEGAVIKENTFTFENVVCGSNFYLFHAGYSFFGVGFSDNITSPFGNLRSLSELHLVAPTEAGAVGTITLFDDD